MLKSKNRTKSNAIRASNQVRIIGGQLKRRQISFIDADGLRPTPDRLRETLFNWLMGELQQARVLDVCAGSGVLGFESISRGAQSATLIELNAAQAKLLKTNAEKLQIHNQVNIIHADAVTALGQLHQAFDVVFLDPPYAKNLWDALLNQLTQQQIITPQTLIYLETDKPLEQVLSDTQLQHTQTLKHTKIGQAFAYLIQYQSPQYQPS